MPIPASDALEYFHIAGRWHDRGRLYSFSLFKAQEQRPQLRRRIGRGPVEELTKTASNFLADGAKMFVADRNFGVVRHHPSLGLAKLDSWWMTND
jgi:hypothetical protein